MTRTERLRKEGKSDSLNYGVLDIVSLTFVCCISDYVYCESDYEYGIDIYSNGEHVVCVLS